MPSGFVNFRFDVSVFYFSGKIHTYHIWDSRLQPKTNGNFKNLKMQLFSIRVINNVLPFH